MQRRDYFKALLGAALFAIAPASIAVTVPKPIKYVPLGEYMSLMIQYEIDYEMVGRILKTYDTHHSTNKYEEFMKKPYDVEKALYDDGYRVLDDWK